MTNEELIFKIKAEIERRKDICSGVFERNSDTYYQGKAVAYDETLSFLSTLESEKPMNPVERIGSYNIVPYIDDKIAALQDMWRKEKVSFDWDDLKDMIEDVARHFTDWQKEQMMDEWLKDRDGCFWDGVEEGKKAMREQMMKEAVKWLVDDDYDELTDKGRFILGSVGIGYNGYYIPYSDLLKLPKEDEQ